MADLLLGGTGGGKLVKLPDSCRDGHEFRVVSSINHHPPYHVTLFQSTIIAYHSTILMSLSVVTAKHSFACID